MSWQTAPTCDLWDKVKTHYDRGKILVENTERVTIFAWKELCLLISILAFHNISNFITASVLFRIFWKQVVYIFNADTFVYINVLCYTVHCALLSLTWLCFTKCDFQIQGHFFTPLSFTFFSHSRVWKLNRGKYLYKTGTGLYKYKTALSEKGRWMKEREDKSTWGLALQPHLGLVYLLYLQTWHQSNCFPQDWIRTDLQRRILGEEPQASEILTNWPTLQFILTKAL